MLKLITPKFVQRLLPHDFKTIKVNLKTLRRIHLNLKILPILIILMIIMQLVDPYKVWVALLIGLGGIFLICSFWIWSLASKLNFTREMRFGWAQVGDHLEERFTLRNTGLFPAVWVEVIDHSNLPGYQPSQATGVDGTSHNSWRSHGECSRRGLFTLGPTSLRTGDPFGIYTISFEDPATVTLTVMPPIVPLPTIEVAPGGRSGEGRPRSNAPEKIVSAAGVREYVPGDNLRWIHWRTTARRDSPYVRIFDGTPAGDWWVFLDVDRHVQLGEGMDSTIEHGVILAASLVDRGLRMKRSVGLVANGEELVWMPPTLNSNNPSRRWELMRALALLNPGDYSLGELLIRTKSAIRNQTSLIIITPNATGDWIEAFIPLLWRGVVPTVLLLDPASFGGEADARKPLAVLGNLEVTRYLITKDLLNQPEARPGHQGEWEWRVAGRGRATPIRKPSNTAWKVFS